jgi:CubicO group peptidase (beta-lactamase class C family)
MIVVLSILLAAGLTGCGPSAEELAGVDYTPQDGGDWEVSTPEAQGLDPALIARLYLNAEDVETIRSLLVVKDGYLIAEKYFHGGSVDSKDRLQSVTKSFTSALAGIALEQGYLTGVNQKMMDFFPELTNRISDPRKREITVQELLQMRAGYPWEESTPELFEMLYHGFKPSLLVDVPLAYDPGTDMDYSNLSAHLAGIIVARAADTDLMAYATENLFGPLGIEPGEWIKDWEGYYNGHADLHLRPRDMAKFGLMYLDEGVYDGRQIIPADWVRDSLTSYTKNAWRYRIGRNYKDIGYGYLWWSAYAGSRRFNFAWGHGGQQITLVEDMDMVIVVTADPLFGQHGDLPWKREKENLNLVADFIRTLPME